MAAYVATALVLLLIVGLIVFYVVQRVGSFSLPWRDSELPTWLQAFAGRLESGEAEVRHEGNAIDTAEINGTLDGRKLHFYTIYERAESTDHGRIPARYSTRFELGLRGPGTLERMVARRLGFLGRLIGRRFVSSGFPELDARRLHFLVKGPLGEGAAIEALEDACQDSALRAAFLALICEEGFSDVTLEDDTVKVSEWLKQGPDRLRPESLEQIYGKLAQVCAAFERQ